MPRLHLSFVIAVLVAVSSQAAVRSGTVFLRQAESRQPVSGVRLTARGGAEGNEILRVAETDSQGHYTLTGLPETNVTVSASKPGYIARPASSSPADFDLNPGAVVSGRITDSQGEPLRGVQIELRNATAESRAVTDDRGVYRLFGLEAGRYVLSARRADQSPSSPLFYPGRNDVNEALVLEVTPGSETECIDLRFGAESAHLPLEAGPMLPTTAEAPPLEADEGASISGAVVSAQTGVPLQSATVRISRFAGGKYFTRTQTTGPGGTYSFHGLEPGSYTISAEKPAYEVRGMSRPVSLTEKQNRTAVDINLNLAPVISGRVRDSEDRPVIDAAVVAYRWRFRNGQRIAVRAAAARTDDRGIYRLTGLAPGRYLVGAASSSAPSDGFPKGELDWGSGKTFYPSTTHPSQAILLEARYGQELTGTNLTLKPQETFSVSGIVADAETSGPCSSCTIRALSLEESASFSQAESTVASDGSYQVRGLPPGNYRIVAEKNSAGRRLLSARNILIANRNITEVNLLAGVSRTVTGRMIFDSDPKATPTLATTAISITFATPDGVSPVEDAEIAADGTFTVHGLSSELYTLAVENLPEGAYLKAVRISGRELANPEIDLSRGEASTDSIELLVTFRSATLGGTVKIADLPDGVVNAVVVLFSREAPARPGIRVSTQPDGTFRLHGAPPGAYTALAFPRDSKLDWDDPQLRVQLKDYAKALVLEASGQASLTLPLVPDE